MRTLRRAALVAAAIWLPASSFAADFSSAVGTDTGQFLKLGVGARAEAMGEAYSAAADGADALYWNPAALALVTDHAVTLMYAPYIASTNYDSAEYAQALGPGSLGVGVQYFGAGSIDETDASGVGIGTFSPSDLAVSIGYGYTDSEPDTALEGWSFGVAGKYIQSKILATAQTFAADVGVLSPYYLDGRLRFAATGTNLGGTMKFESVSESLPAAARVGALYKFNSSWIGTVDAIFPSDNQPAGAVGTEYRMALGGGVGVAARAGYNTRTGNVPGFTGGSFGVGLSFGKLSFDYALVPFGDLGLTHRISLSARF